MHEVIAIFDIGKTNKKFFLFDKQYRIVHQNTVPSVEAIDEDGFPCEDLKSLCSFIRSSLNTIPPQFELRALNFSGYGASFVFIDERGKPAAPLYSYLKPFPKNLSQQFYDSYCGAEKLSLQTASPVLGSLNSGLQLYRIKYQKPQLFSQIKWALHLPQFLNYLVTGFPCSEITSIGCHTHLWNFETNSYHPWVSKEGIEKKLAPLVSSEKTLDTTIGNKTCKTGIGLHDSSAALIPYLQCFREPFVLISTGTWSISLNPFNRQPLTAEELEQDCLSYLTYKGDTVKAARFFIGHLHDEEIKKLADHFTVGKEFYKAIVFNKEITEKLRKREDYFRADLAAYSSVEEAYHSLMLALVEKQYESTRLVIQDTGVKKIFVDGGFSQNPLYMSLLAAAFPHFQVYAASVAQCTALGAAMAIHHSWDKEPLPSELIQLKLYSPEQKFPVM